MSGAASHSRDAGRLASTFRGEPGRVFLVENGETWTVGRLLAYAGDIASAIPAGAGTLVAVRSHTAAFVVASLFAAWAKGRSPLLVDPELTSEPSGLRDSGDRMPVIAPANVDDVLSDVAVPETGSAPITPVFPGADDLEVAFFTSGSTGEPRFVRKKAYQLAEQHQIEAAWLGLTEAPRVLCLVPPFHILGYIYGFDMPACSGGITMFQRRGAPQLWVEQILAQRPALVVAVPSHYRLIARVLAQRLPPAVYLSSGAPLDPAIGEEFERRAGAPVLQVYGSTETGGIATRLAGGAWRPLPGLLWRSREGDGRLLVKSPWQDRPEDWHVTDDVVAEDGAGFRLLGRADSIVKVGGRRFSTGEVVQAALAEPRVDHAHAIVYHRFGEPAVALFVVPRENAEITGADVRGCVAARLAAFKVPRTIHIVATLPRRGIGKVDEEALRAFLSPSIDA